MKRYLILGLFCLPSFVMAFTGLPTTGNTEVIIRDVSDHISTNDADPEARDAAAEVADTPNLATPPRQPCTPTADQVRFWTRKLERLVESCKRYPSQPWHLINPTYEERIRSINIDAVSQNDVARLRDRASTHAEQLRPAYTRRYPGGQEYDPCTGPADREWEQRSQALRRYVETYLPFIYACEIAPEGMTSSTAQEQGKVIETNPKDNKRYLCNEPTAQWRQRESTQDTEDYQELISAHQRMELKQRKRDAQMVIVRRFERRYGLRYPPFEEGNRRSMIVADKNFEKQLADNRLARQYSHELYLIEYERGLTARQCESRFIHDDLPYKKCARMKQFLQDEINQ